MEFPNPYESPESALPVIQVAKPSPPPAAPPRKFVSLELITRLLQLSYLVLLGVGLFVAVLCFQSRGVMTELNGINPRTARTNAVRHNELVKQFKNNMSMLQILGGPVVKGISLVLVVALIGWVYKASCNLPALQAEGATRSPALAALGMLIPVVNLFVALPILNRLALGSDPERWSPYGSKAQGMSMLVVSWWGLNLLSIAGAVYLLIAVIPHAQSREDVYQMLGVQGGLMLFGSLPVILAWWMFGMIHSNQEKRALLVQNAPARPQVAVVPDYLAAEGK